MPEFHKAKAPSYHQLVEVYVVIAADCNMYKTATHMMKISFTNRVRY